MQHPYLQGGGSWHRKTDERLLITRHLDGASALPERFKFTDRKSGQTWSISPRMRAAAKAARATFAEDFPARKTAAKPL
jgi:hypothetical protein